VKTLYLAGTPDAWTFRRFAQACADLGVNPTHVLHVGGHLGQEVEHYRAAGVERITYMEPTRDCAEVLRQLGPDVEVIEAAAGPADSVPILALCGGDGAWNTLRPVIGTGAGVHLSEGGMVVRVVPIRDVQGDADVLVVDTQGTEVEALATADLDSPELRVVIVETQTSGHPEAAHLDEVRKIMAVSGWVPVLAWSHEYANRPHATFADVFFVPRELAT
jgi:hypothetical protein